MYLVPGGHGQQIDAPLRTTLPSLSNVSDPSGQQVQVAASMTVEKVPSGHREHTPSCKNSPAVHGSRGVGLGVG